MEKSFLALLEFLDENMVWWLIFSFVFLVAKHLRSPFNVSPNVHHHYHQDEDKKEEEGDLL